MASTHPNSAVDRPLVVRARPDVQPARTHFSGQAAYVLKDPLTLELFHLTPEEFFLFENLMQSFSLKGLQQAFEARFAPRRITLQQLQQGVNQLHGQGLLISEAAGQGCQLRERAAQRQRSERLQSVLKLLSFRLGSIDATRLVDRLHGRLQGIFSWPVRLAVLALLGYALLILLGHGGEILASLPSLVELSQPRHWLMWLTTIALVKVLHELAHALTCKHVGGRCHEMGVMLLAFLPCLYCDVTDVWRLPSKWQRIAVSAAGMVAESVVASLALVIWWHTQPGLLQTWCLSVVMVCSVGTLLVNVNPLLRYDGYYILTDLVEVPNLAGRAQGLLPAALRRWLLTESRSDDPLLSPRQRRGLWVYAVAARVYLTLVLLGIFVVLLTWARPYRAENLVYTLGVVTVAGMCFRPLSGIWQLLRNPSLRFRMRRWRLISLALVALGLIAAFFYWPITRSVSGPAVLVPRETQPLYATSAGTLQFALPAGKQVQAGEELARLVDSQAQLAVVRQQGEVEVRQVRYEQLSAMRTWNSRFAQELPTAGAAVKDASAQLAQYQAKASELVIRAPTAGVIVAPPAIDESQREADRLAEWTGSPLEPRNQGCWIEAGTLLCTVADPKRLEVLVAVDQTDAPEVEAGQSVRLLLESSPVRVLKGEVIQVARRAEARTAVDTRIDAGKYHLVEVRLDSPATELLLGTRGTAKIESQRSTLSRIVASELRRMFKLPW